jgi:hypothetical protein
MSGERRERAAEVLHACGKAVAAVLEEYGYQSEHLTFSILVWPPGKPAYCSFICGGYVRDDDETVRALEAALRKARRGVSKVIDERNIQ